MVYRVNNWPESTEDEKWMSAGKGKRESEPVSWREWSSSLPLLLQSYWVTRHLGRKDLHRRDRACLKGQSEVTENRSCPSQVLEGP